MIPSEDKMDPKGGPIADPISDDKGKQGSDDQESADPSERRAESQTDELEQTADNGNKTDSVGEESQVSELEVAQAEIEVLTEKYLLARAEVENIRKRADSEIVNIRKFALESFVRELLSVKDSLDLAKAIDLTTGVDDSGVVEKVVEGINLTIKQLESVFDRFEIEKVSPQLGDKLDPDLHQAVSVEETSDFEPSQICRVIQKGYLLHSRLLRPAMVMVAKAPDNS